MENFENAQLKNVTSKKKSDIWVWVLLILISIFLILTNENTFLIYILPPLFLFAGINKYYNSKKMEISSKINTDAPSSITSTIKIITFTLFTLLLLIILYFLSLLIFIH